ncbi:HET-domain-containing protein [Nemania diffusa]|nr:HET-domain-containing protein [Nemania diffusa]
MRLIHTTTLRFHEFEQPSSDVPPYAILSHTWGDEEVTFHDMSLDPTGAATREKKGYDKITQTCRLAREENLEYVWIDACCIDKSSSAELSEAINSMFEWYASSAGCYAFLFDYVPGDVGLARGWTLQELLAPKRLVFYDSAWDAVGTKAALVEQVSDITHIIAGVILDKSHLSRCSISQRMSWAASRQTTRIEDEAYCLLGIFGIHIPLIYGEGRMAFRRLQEEIIKRSADPTIFFWDTPAIKEDQPEFSSLFAESPHAFRSAVNSGLTWLRFPEFIATNKGVLFSSVRELIEIRMAGEDHYTLYGFLHENGTDTRAIPLRKVGPGVFCRSGRFPLQRPNDYQINGSPSGPSRFYIMPDPVPNLETLIDRYRWRSIYVPKRIKLSDVAPRHLWDATDRILISPPDLMQCDEGVATIMGFENIILESPGFFVVTQFFPLSRHCELKLFQGTFFPDKITPHFRKYPENLIPLSDLYKLTPNFDSLSNSVEVHLYGGGSVRIKVTTSEGILEPVPRTLHLRVLNFVVSPLN